MKTKEKILASLAGIVAIVLLVILSSVQASKVEGSGFVESTCDTAGNSSSLVASSSLVSLPTASASSTLPCSFPTAQSIDLNLAVVASSTSSVIQYDIAYSNNDVDWYYATGYGNASSSTISSVPSIFFFKPNQTATTTANVTFSTNGSRYVQIRFKGTGAASMIYAQMVAKNVIPN